MFKNWNNRGVHRKRRKLGYKPPSSYHPFIKQKKIPVYVSNFILMDYGTGAIFGCPAHDTRDLEFAKNIRLRLLQ